MGGDLLVSAACKRYADGQSHKGCSANMVSYCWCQFKSTQTSTAKPCGLSHVICRGVLLCIVLHLHCVFSRCICMIVYGICLQAHMFSMHRGKYLWRQVLGITYRIFWRQGLGITYTHVCIYIYIYIHIYIYEYVHQWGLR